MNENEINVIKQNIDKTMYVNLPNSVSCKVIGYGFIPSLLYPEKMVLKVLLNKNDNQNKYRFPWQTELEKYEILSSAENLNPDNFLAVPYDCIRTDVDDNFLSCY